MKLKLHNVILLLSLLFLQECSGDFPLKKCPKDSPCTPIQECPGMLELLESRNQKEIDQVQKITCGVMEVCCQMGCPVVPLGKDLIPKECGMPEQGKIDPLILGGEKAPREAYPWMVALYRKVPRFPEEKIFTCGGSLISERYVITAGHCVEKENTYEVHIGDWDRSTDIDCDLDTDSCSSSHIVANVEEIIIHPHFALKDSHKFNRSDDIALLRLDAPVPLTSSHIKTICLPPRDFDPEIEAKGDKLIAMGWGQTENMIPSDVLLHVQLPFSKRETCRDLYGCEFYNEQLCVGGEKGINMCFGDSGGPLVLSGQPEKPYVLVGIVSHGNRTIPCGLEGHPTVFTSVSSYIDWILQNLKP